MGNPAGSILEICSRQPEGYGQGLPSALDRDFAEVARVYTRVDAEGRAQLRSQVSAACGRFLLGFGSRLAVWAARTEDVELLQLALVAHLLEDFQDDERDIIIRLILIHHVATRLNLETDEFFSGVSSVASESSRAFLLRFVEIPDSAKALSAFGWTEVETPEGIDFRYQSTPPSLPSIPR